MNIIRIMGVALCALILSSCALNSVSTQSSGATGDARKVSEFDVLYLAHRNIRVDIQRYRSIYFRDGLIDNGSLTGRVGDIVTAFGEALVGTFDAAARTSGVLRAISVATTPSATTQGIAAALAEARFERDVVLAISANSANVVCADSRCSFEISFGSALFDTKAKKTMWSGRHSVTLVRTVALPGPARVEFESAEIVESYWNAVLATLRSDRLIDKDVTVKLRSPAR